MTFALFIMFPLFYLILINIDDMLNMSTVFYMYGITEKSTRQGYLTICHFLNFVNDTLAWLNLFLKYCTICKFYLMTWMIVWYVCQSVSVHRTLTPYMVWAGGFHIQSAICDYYLMYSGKVNVSVWQS